MGESNSEGYFSFPDSIAKSMESEDTLLGYLRDSRGPKFPHETPKELSTTRKNAAGNGNPVNGVLTIGHPLIV